MSGRSEERFEKLIGCLTLPIIVRVTDFIGLTFQDYLKKVACEFFNCIRNSTDPYYVTPSGDEETDMQRIFSSESASIALNMFNYVPFPKMVSPPGLKVSEKLLFWNAIRPPQGFYFYVFHGEFIEFYILYRPSAFDKSVIERFLERYLTQLKYCLEHRDFLISK